MLWFWSFLCFRFFLTAAAARARAEETAWEGAEEALRGNGAAPQRGGEEACRERTGSYTYCSIILRRYYCMQTDSTVPQECETRWQVHNPSLALKFSFVFPFPFKATSPPPPSSSWLTVIVLVSLNALKVMFFLVRIAISDTFNLMIHCVPVLVAQSPLWVQFPQFLLPSFCQHVHLLSAIFQPVNQILLQQRTAVSLRRISTFPEVFKRTTEYSSVQCSDLYCPTIYSRGHGTLITTAKANIQTKRMYLCLKRIKPSEWWPLIKSSWAGPLRFSANYAHQFHLEQRTNFKPAFYPGRTFFSSEREKKRVPPKVGRSELAAKLPSWTSPVCQLIL